MTLFRFRFGFAARADIAKKIPKRTVRSVSFSFSFTARDGLSEYIPYNVLYINFMEAQGYHIKYNILYQDNQSAIRMERNGRNSCTGNSRHIHIRYFFVKDRVDKGEVEVLCCRTEQMLADYFTKPLQGALFEKFKSVIMGHQHISILRNPSNKERVDNNEITGTVDQIEENV